MDVGSISAALSCPVYVRGRSAGSFPEQQLVIEPSMGVESTLRCARTSLRWPGMNSQLKQFISSCQVCESFQRNNPKESLMGHSIPDRPWSKIAPDLFELKEEHCLVLIDYYSDWIEFDKMRDQIAAEDIAPLLKHAVLTMGTSR